VEETQRLAMPPKAFLSAINFLERCRVEESSPEITNLGKEENKEEEIEIGTDGAGDYLCTSVY